MTVELFDDFTTVQSAPPDGNTHFGTLPTGVNRYMTSIGGVNVSATGGVLSIDGGNSSNMEYKDTANPGTSPFSLSGATQFVFTVTSGAIRFRVISSGGDYQADFSSGTHTVPFATALISDPTELQRIRIENTSSSPPCTMSMIAADPHVLCLDGSRLDVYAAGFYRYYDNGATDPSLRVIANVEVRQFENGEDYAHALWVHSAATGPVQHTFDGNSETSLFVRDPLHEADLTFILEDEHRTVAMKADWSTLMISAGGLMSGRVQSVGSLADTSVVTCRPVALFLGNKAHSEHALVCGSMDPHAVSFSGARVEVGGESQLLFGLADTNVFATFCGKRLSRLWVEEKETGDISFGVTWDLEQHQSISSMDVCFGAMRQRETGAEGLFEAWFGPLLVRVQPGGVASFQMIGGTTNAIGILTTPLVSTMRTSVRVNGGLYAETMEPHLLYVGTK